LFRREFLLDHNIRYPEGKVRLEDHYFVTHAYLHARTISVYADHVCYHHNHPGGEENFSRSATDPEIYESSNREVIELILRHTEKDAALRSALLRRPVQHELLKKAGPRRLAQLDAAGEARKHKALRGVLLEVAPEVVDQLGPFPRATARALRGDDPHAVRRIDAREERLALTADVVALRQEPGGILIDYTLRLDHDGTEVVFHPVETGTWRLDPAVMDLADADRDDREADLVAVDVELVVSHRKSAVQWHLANQLIATLEPRGDGTAIWVGRGTGELRAADLASSRLNPGIWDVRLRTEILGVGLATRLAVPDQPGTPQPPVSALLRGGNLRATAVVTPRSTLALDVKRLHP
jgi:hypothetical protein